MENDSFRTIESIGRLKLISELSEATPFRNERVIMGVGDDASVLEETRSRAGLLTSEVLLEGIDFDLTYTPLHHLGYKTVTAGVSNIYAMNGRPDSLHINLALPNKISVEMVKELYRGVDAACNDYGVEVAGGGLNASHQILVLAVSAHGWAEKDKLIYRSGACEGDAICVTGDLGGAIAGLRILMREKMQWKEEGESRFQPDLGDYEYVVRRQLVPKCRTDFLSAIAGQGIRPTAMTRLNGGLAGDLHQLAEASGTGAYLYQAALPLAIETRQVADEMEEDADKYALYGGEDFELLFTLPEEQVEELASCFSDFVVVGKITNRAEGVKMLSASGDVIIFEEDKNENGEH